jgi:hypothetical protein
MYLLYVVSDVSCLDFEWCAKVKRNRVVSLDVAAAEGWGGGDSAAACGT